jgi:hypothetical protein
VTLLAILATAPWLPLAVGVAGIAAAILLWQSLLSAEKGQLAFMGDVQARSMSTELQRAFQSVTQSFTTMAQRHGAVLRDGGPFHLEMTGLEATAWAEPSGKVRNVDSPKGNHDLAGADLTALDTDRAALLKARQIGQPVVTDSIVLPGGSAGFHLLVPLSDEGRPSGFIVGVFSERGLAGAVLERDPVPLWTFAVFEGDRELYRIGSPGEGRWLAESTFKFADTARRLRVSAGPELIARLHGPLPGVVLTTGVVISLLLAASVGLAQAARRRARDAERAQTALQESEEQYRLLFDNNPQPMWVYDEETLAFLAVNDAAVRHYGYSRDEFLAMTVWDVHASEETQVEEHITTVARQDGRESARSLHVWKHRKKDGALIDVEIAVSPIEFRGRKARLKLATDVTETKRLEAQLLQAQKMESVGKLAGGVAHDFNNLLGVITGYGELLARRLPDDPGLRKYVDDIMKAAERAADLTRQLLAFSRKQVLRPRIIDLNAIVGEMEKMLQRLIGEDVQLVTRFADPLGRVKADPGQIEQVLMNLAVNARDAMPQGGRLTIETANVNLDAAYVRSRPDVEPGPHVVLAVSDTGQGMDPEVLSHVFEPFFTTKEPGKGTGLGLATVHGIVKQSGGHIFVYSEAEHGTTFKIYLPRLEDAAEVLKIVPTEDELPGGSETVLLVEDEASLRSLVRECLEASGYAVLEARHAGHALEIIERHASPIHLLMTDVIMPGLSGRELARRVTASRPEMKVLYMSGYTDDAVVLHGVLAADVAFLQKPFTAEALARKVREVLDQPAYS